MSRAALDRLTEFLVEDILQTSDADILKEQEEDMVISAGLRFEPHNGFGKKDFDGNPWPFGYISDAQPIFELNVILKRDRKKLEALALQMAAAPAMLEALKTITRRLREASDMTFDQALRELTFCDDIARAAVAASTPQVLDTDGRRQ